MKIKIKTINLREIMNLANEFTYEGKLQCISEKVANGSIKFSEVFLSSVI